MSWMSWTLFSQSKHREELVCDGLGNAVSVNDLPAGLLLAQKKMRSSRKQDFKIMLPHHYSTHNNVLN